MAFMKAYVYQGKFWLVETTHGTECVPFDVETDPTQLGSLVEGEITEVPEAHDGFYGRYSAPGYLDATPWRYGYTAEEVEGELDEMYGDPE